MSWTDLIGPHGKVHDLFVDEAFRGRGIGEALLREAVRRLVDRGAPRVLLDRPGPTRRPGACSRAWATGPR